MTTINYNEHDPVEIEYSPDSHVKTEASLRQMMAFDIIPDEMLLEEPERLGLHACSQEVWDAEQQAAQQRRNNIGPVLPLLSVLARLSSELQTEAILVRQEEDPDVEDAPSASHILSASVGILAALVDLGVVHLAHPEIGVIES